MIKYVTILLLSVSLSLDNQANAANQTHLLAMNADMNGLNYTDNDRKKIIKAVRSITKKNHLKLYSAKNTSLNLYRRMITDLKQAAHPNDTVIIYFSGHGIQVIDRNQDEIHDKLDEAIVTFNPSRKATFDDLLLDDEMAKDIRRLPSKQVYIIMDTCHAAGMQKSYQPVKQTPKFIRNLNLKRLQQQQTLLPESTLGFKDITKGVLFAAASENQLAIEDSNIAGGLFTHEFAKALEYFGDYERAFNVSKRRVARMSKHHQIPKRSSY